MVVHTGHINKTTTLPLLTEEEWSQATSDDHNIGYFKRILSIIEETTIDTKELIKKGSVHFFNQGRLKLDNGLIYYYDTPRTYMVRQLIIIVLPVKFRLVLMLACHVSPLAGHSHDQRTIFRIVARFR